MEKDDKFDVAVVGAGPAGMMAAGVAAQTGAKVILIEKNKQLGTKLLLTGNGRCNVTNAEFDLRKLVENYGEGGKFLFHAFSVFGPKEAISFFESLGVKTKIENNKRVFPISEKAETVLNAFKNYLLKNKVNIYFDARVSRVVVKNNKIEKLIVGDNEIIAKKYIFCTGGKSRPLTGSAGDGFKWAKDLGHNIRESSPALVPIKLKGNLAKDLQGLVLKEIKISVLQNNKKQFQEIGDVLFTDNGLSGPTILNMSKKIGVLLKKGEVKLALDFFPNLTVEDLDKKMQEKIEKNSNRSIKNFLADFISQRLVIILMKKLGIADDRQANNITKEQRKIIVNSLKNFEVPVAGLLGFDVAMATSGGVSLKEIDDKTMKSKIIDNLYFAGEIIDIDGRTGGFNLQSCWGTGQLAGKSAASMILLD